MSVKQLLVFAACYICMLARPVFSKCCYTISSRTLDDSFYEVSFTASSQSVLGSPNKIYSAVIGFPSNHTISSIPNGCSFLATTSVICHLSGQSQLALSFYNMTLEDPPAAANLIVVNGEKCTLNTTCQIPVYTPCSASLQSSATLSVTPLPSGDAHPEYENRGMVIGLSCSLGSLALIAGFLVLRRGKIHDADGGVQRRCSKNSFYNDKKSHDAFGGSEAYASYPEKTSRRQSSIREIQEPAVAAVAAVAAKTVEDVQLDLEKMETEERLRSVASEHAVTVVTQPKPACHPSTRAAVLDTEVVHIPSASLLENGVSLVDYFQGETDRFVCGRSIAEVDKNAISLDNQHSLLRKSRSSDPWPAETKLLSKATRTASLHRAASVSVIGTGRFHYYHANNILSYCPHRQQVPSHFSELERSHGCSLPRQNHWQYQRYNGQRSEPIRVADHQVVDSTAPYGHSLYGYL
ncbi:hypothetical protein BGZ65_002462 [Modicella reniformis]|uniref:Uncharacterized protein n=1 Tax=Modicella reniformis TaxID=1440133 RepID=A0A9P6M0E7_9FUNG|nr:hypothetical protein BGZ65_002462 [Modicella reniformis]